MMTEWEALHVELVLSSFPMDITPFQYLSTTTENTVPRPGPLDCVWAATWASEELWD